MDFIKKKLLDYISSVNETKVKTQFERPRSKSVSELDSILRPLKERKLISGSMDDLDAPQWADFIHPSPQLSLDDYFLKKRGQLEYREPATIDSDSTAIPSPLNESIIKITPVRIMTDKLNKSTSKKSNLKETTYENVLTEAMNNLQLSFKKGEKSFNKSCLIDSPVYKTPLKRVTRSMCAQASSTTKKELNESHYVSLDDESESEKEDKLMEQHEYECAYKLKKENENRDAGKNQDEHESKEVYDSKITEESNEKIAMKEHESSNEQSYQIHLELTTSGSEHEISREKLQTEQEIAQVKEKDNEIIQIKVVEPKIKNTSITHINTSNSSGSNLKKKVTALTGNAWHKQMKRRMSISNQRRMSINKGTTRSKASGSTYVSMAEAVTKFQRVTPQRFHTTAVKTTKTEQLRRMSFKLTRATSPALISKNRSRPVTAISTEEKERLELEKIRQNQIKANPVKKAILEKPALLKKVEKKMVTNPEPFHLTKTKKGQSLPPKPNKEVKRVPRTKTVPSIVSTDDKGIIIKQEEVLHFGIPLEPCKLKKKSTKVQPFSFEQRNKELEMKRQEKLKMMQESEKQKNKTEFHARPVPTAVKTPINKPPQTTNSSQKPKITIARSLSFEQRHKELQKKKEEKIKQLLEEEKKARIFKAQKVPEFKPVMIRGRSRDNLHKKSEENLATKAANISGSANKSGNIKTSTLLKKPQENLKSKTNFIKKPMSIPFVAAKTVSPPSSNIENQENRNQCVAPKIMEPKCKLSQKSVAVLSELNTDKRAKQRKEFDEQIKKKEIEEEEMKKQEEEDRVAKEKAQKLELRKMTEIKARPMPVYKQMNIVKSNKPLTEAQSPAWAKRRGSTH